MMMMMKYLKQLKFKKKTPHFGENYIYSKKNCQNVGSYKNF